MFRLIGLPVFALGLSVYWVELRILLLQRNALRCGRASAEGVSTGCRAPKPWPQRPLF